MTNNHNNHNNHENNDDNNNNNNAIMSIIRETWGARLPLRLEKVTDQTLKTYIYIYIYNVYYVYTYITYIYIYIYIHVSFYIHLSLSLYIYIYTYGSRSSVANASAGRLRQRQDTRASLTDANQHMFCLPVSSRKCAILSIGDRPKSHWLVQDCHFLFRWDRSHVNKHRNGTGPICQMVGDAQP